MKKTIFSFAAILVVSVFIGSCKKAEVDTETQSATDNATCEGEFMAIGPNTNNKAIAKGGSSGFKVSGLPIMTIDSLGIDGAIGPKTYPRILTIDYQTGVVDAIDGKTRSGIIMITIDTNWIAPVLGFAKHASIKFTNYIVNGAQYAADSIYITRQGNTENFRVINGSCWNANWHLEWSCNRTITSTIDGSGNITSVSISGNANGKNKDGVTYTVNITSPVVKSTSCQWIESGVVEITPDGKATRTLDYSEGGGGCDNKASLTIKGNKFVFSMN